MKPLGPGARSKAQHIVFVGCRGIPARYGGFETFAQELATRLAARGMQVTVTCEETAVGRPSTYRGVNLDYLPRDPPTSYARRKFFEVLSDYRFLLRWRRKADTIYLMAVVSNLAMPLTRLLMPRAGRLVINIDGVEWRRSKFNALERFLFWSCYSMAFVAAHTIVVDAAALRKIVPRIFHKKVVYIPYGVVAPEKKSWDPARLAAAGISATKNEFWLIVARLEPENHIDLMLKGYLESGSNRPLIVVGGATSSDYQKKLKSIAASRQSILMVGAIYDSELLNMLRQNSLGYLHGHSVGGTNPSLLEAMSMRNVILAHDNEFNREVLGPAGRYFGTGAELGSLIRALESESSPTDYGKLAAERVQAKYNWDQIEDSYVALFSSGK